MKYYTHEDTGYYDAYFGNIGKPVEVGYAKYLTAKYTGCVVTVAENDASLRDVHIMAQIKAGADPNSFKIKKLKERYDNND